MKWCVADLTSIESVGAAWLAGCDTVLDIFHAGRDTYKTMAAHCEGIPYGAVDKPTRTLYKPIVLGGIYRLSGRGLVDYAASMGVELDLETANKQVRHLRHAWHEIPHYWKQLQHAVTYAVDYPGQTYSAYAADGVEGEWQDARGNTHRQYRYREWPRVDYRCDGEFLFCTLPSGRRLCYHRPRMDMVEIRLADGKIFETRSLHYWGNDQKAGGVWREIQVHSGHLLENITQAVCRDILWDGGLMRAELDDDMLVVGDVYDELWTLVDDNDTTALDRLVGYMTTRPDWVDERFFLGAEGYISERYRKD